MPLLPAELDQFLLQLFGRKGLLRFHDQIAEIGRRALARAGTAVAVRFREIADRLAAEQIIHQHAILDQRNLLRAHAFVVRRSCR